MSEPAILSEQRDTTVILTVNRPKALNAINDNVIQDLDRALDDLPESCRAVVLTGAGDKAFIAGADIKAMTTMSPKEAEWFGRRGHEVASRFGQLDVPMIAAVNGYCLGGGCEMMLACDFALASQSAVFGLPEVGLGVIPGFGGTTRLSRRIGGARAQQLVLTGEKIGAEAALQLGLVNEVVAPDELIDRALAIGAQIAKNAPRAVALAKRSVHVGAETDLSTANRYEIAAFGLCFATEDQREGMTAFVERRSPEWKGR